MPNPDPDTTAPDDGYEPVGYLDDLEVPPSGLVRRFQPHQVEAAQVPAASEPALWGEIVTWLIIDGVAAQVTTDEDGDFASIDFEDAASSWSADPGDWVVRTASRHFHVVAADAFETTHVPAVVKRVVVVEDRAGEWRFSARAGNNKSVAVSGEGLTTKSYAEHIASQLFPGALVVIAATPEAADALGVER